MTPKPLLPLLSRGPAAPPWNHQYRVLHPVISPYDHVARIDVLRRPDTINRSQIYQLATAQFVRERRDVLLLGPPGLGKNRIAQAIGYAALRVDFNVLYASVFELVRELQADPTPAEARRTLARYLKPDLLCLDDFGMKSFPPKGAEALLEIIVRRHRNRSTLMTSNRPIEEWGALLGDVPAATAILDRLLEGTEIVRMSGRSDRLRNAQVAASARKKVSGR